MVGLGGVAGGGAVATPAAPPDRFDVTLVNGAIEPAEFTIPANADVTIAVVNNGSVGHDFTLEDQDITTSMLDVGAAAEVVVNLPPGTYVYYCSQPGHRENGMQGTLIVQEEAASAASGFGEPIRILLNDTMFEPSVITVPANVDIQLLLENRGYLMHDLAIAKPKYVSSPIGNGQSTTMVINVPAGEHEFYCSQIGHRQMGMTGKIVAT